MEPDQHFLGGWASEPVGFGAVHERYILRSESFLLCKGGICFIEAGGKPLNISSTTLARNGSDHGDLDMVGEFGGAGAATEGRGDEIEEAITDCFPFSSVTGTSGKGTPYMRGRS